MLVYCAGPLPLDGVSWEEGRGWYEAATASAPPGAVLYFPGHAFAYQGQDPSGMDRANRAVIEVADALLVNLGGPGRALGTCREVEFARSLGKPVVVVAPDGLETLLAYDLFVEDTLEEAWLTLKARVRWLVTSTGAQ